MQFRTYLAVILFCCFLSNAYALDGDRIVANPHAVAESIAERKFNELGDLLGELGLTIRTWLRLERSNGKNVILKEYVGDDRDRVICGYIQFSRAILFYRIIVVGENVDFGINTAPRDALTGACRGLLKETDYTDRYIEDLYAQGTSIYDFYRAMYYDEISVVVDAPALSADLKNWNINRMWNIKNYSVGERFTDRVYAMELNNGVGLMCTFHIHKTDEKHNVVNGFTCDEFE